MPGGGVCAVLDYNVETMAEYVSEMAVRLVTPHAAVTSPFKKFVSQILSSTRLPKSTILLGMNYLAKRTNIHNASGTFQPTEGQVWRMLTVALLLGSKFLDDNTFQNRSWSEVSSIPVQELNLMENQWLASMEWSLYVNLETSSDYTAWLDSWDDWLREKRRAAAQANRDRLAILVTPIETDVSYKRGSWHQQQIAEYERLSSLKRNGQAQSAGYRSHDGIWNQYPANSWGPAAPLTPPDSGYGTPESNNLPVYSYYSEWANKTFGNTAPYPRSMRQNKPAAYSARQSTYPGYYNPAPPHGWEAYHGERGCVHCDTAIHVQPQPFYQSVMG